MCIYLTFPSLPLLLLSPLSQYSTPSNNTICLVPVGSFDEHAPNLCGKLVEFLKAYFLGMEVSLLPTVTLSSEESPSKGKKKPADGKEKAPKKKDTKKGKGKGKKKTDEDEAEDDSDDGEEEDDTEQKRVKRAKAGKVFIHTVRRTRSRDIPIATPVPWRVAHPYDLEKVSAPLVDRYGMGCHSASRFEIQRTLASCV